jgi:hypothetical protein|tara:strand:+ start:323 stop:490 length:168 start_codon:yes stop_codon:yes gene_type:complete
MNADKADAILLPEITLLDGEMVGQELLKRSSQKITSLWSTQVGVFGSHHGLYRVI